MSEIKLRVLWLYPDILNLHGDRGNVPALQRVCAQLGIQAEIRRVNRLADEVDLRWADLLLINPGELVVMPAVIAALRQRTGGLETFVQEGRGILCVGTSGAVLARETRRQSGETIQGLGLLRMCCEERATIYGNDIIYHVDGLEEDICGIQIQMMDTFLEEGQAPLGSLVYGHGNSGQDTGAEGALGNNVVFTNALGPVLVKNPWLARWLIQRVLGPRHAEMRWEVKDKAWQLERLSAQNIHDFNATK